MFISKSFLAEIANNLRTDKIDAEEYVKEICKLIDEKEKSVKALIPEKNREERLLNEVKRLKKQFPDPENRPAFYGVPVGIKDIIKVDGFKTQGGSVLPAELFEGKQASLVTKLQNAGAIILGKTVTTEFAYFEPGPTRNPHNLNHTPGGSSSGSAAAVACGYTPFALGTQTIGSITRPAAYCGIIGFKPSFDRISKDGVIPFSGSADHIGMFAQDLDGINLGASVLCNNWNSDLKSETEKPVIGIMTDKYLDLADDEIRTHFENSIYFWSWIFYFIK